MKCRHRMPFGADIDADGNARFRLWAPNAQRVVLEADSTRGRKLEVDLNAAGDGWFELEIADVGAAAEYRYRIDDEFDAPDPASRFNPQGVQGASRLVDPESFEWLEEGWRGRPWCDAVVYEMHVGAFTPAGTYAAAGERLDDLAELGVTAIELMPLAAFAGRRGWGYDGVLQFAPHAAYGEPDDLKRFVQAGHQRNLMVLLDVVYNHFGPEGNYLPRYARDFFTRRHRTPWGDAIDFAHPQVRQFFIQNALYWLNEYRFDGLRIDAVHAMHDDSPTHFIDELIETVRQGPGRERCVHVVLENHNNEARRLQRESEPSPSAVRRPPFTSAVAQWNDDSHHVLHVIVTGEKDGYYIDYADQPLAHLGRVLTQGFAYQGERSAFSGERRGEPCAHLPPTAFVNFLQNHDQVGNRAFGERIAQLAASERLRAAYSILLLSPQIPMLFMGGEYAASQPFLYFCDYEGELAAAVRAGRREEFAGFGAFADEAARASIPDPNAQTTFEKSRLDWTERDRPPHAERLEHVRILLGLRASHVTPRIAEIVPGKSSFEVSGQCISVRWPLRNGSALVMLANLGEAPASLPAPDAELIYSTIGAPPDAALLPWEVRLVLVQADAETEGSSRRERRDR
ncbi:MAG: malto-oligosyltrehalose trehalohydrolase [Steroidobacter sp.]